MQTDSPLASNGSADPSPSPASVPRSMSPGQRMAVRLFVIAMALIILIETMPSQVNGYRMEAAIIAKKSLSPWTGRLGLWQGEWPLFAPNPVLNNAWISADITSPTGETINWNSTYWASASSWEKFRHFRDLNYFNRLPFRGPAVADDFADYVARQEIGREVQALDNSAEAVDGTWTLQLNRNELNLNLPDDGPLPTREETLWIVTSRQLATRRYKP